MNKKLSFVYVCTRGAYELFNFIKENFPLISESTTLVSTSCDAMVAIPPNGEVVVFTSNVFHHPDLLGADDGPEHKMDGAKLATLIKEKNPHAQVYLYSERVTNESVFDGVFRRNLKGGVPSDVLIQFLQKLEQRMEKGIYVSS